MIYLVTGAAGHLGNTIVKQLVSQGKSVRCLVLPCERAAAELPGKAAVYTGNVLDKTSLEPFFRHDAKEPSVVIHCAGIVSIASGLSQNIYDVNVTGTQNVIDLCLTHRVKRLVYVSSVHALPELPKGQLISETKDFDPDRVVGGYAKTKAEATKRALAAAKNGLDVCVVHPSGICGPNDYGRGHMTQLLIDFCKRKMTAGLTVGGYDFVDVRDVAAGIISCCEKGKSGETYILSNRYYSVRELLEMFHQITGLKPVRTFLPLWFAKATAPLSELYYKILRQPPLYTPYSLYTLTSNAAFSHSKADRMLDYTCRPIKQTIRDTFEWLKSRGKV